MKSNKKKYNRIKVILAEQEKSSKWLSKQIGRDKSTVSRWCTNDIQPSLPTLFKIADILNISPKDLLTK